MEHIPNLVIRSEEEPNARNVFEREISNNVARLKLEDEALSNIFNRMVKKYLEGSPEGHRRAAEILEYLPEEETISYSPSEDFSTESYEIVPELSRPTSFQYGTFLLSRKDNILYLDYKPYEASSIN